MSQSLNHCFNISDYLPLPQVTQLTGFSDPVYAEAYVNVNQYDIVLDVLIVNQTSDTLQNLTLELATLGEWSLDKQHWNRCSVFVSLDFWLFQESQIY